MHSGDEVASSTPVMNSWFRRGVPPPFVRLNGTKVSKSLGNVLFHLCREWDPAAARLAPARPPLPRRPDWRPNEDMLAVRSLWRCG